MPMSTVNAAKLAAMDANLDPGVVANSEALQPSLDDIASVINGNTAVFNTHQSAPVLDHPDSSVTTAKIADGSVTTAKIADGTILNVDISATAAIDGSKLANLTITSAQIADGTIVNADISPTAAIDGSKLANLSITSTQIADGTIVDVDINAAAAVAWSKISKAGSSLADLATRSANDLNTGTLPAAQLPALTGDITTSTGSAATTLKNTGTAGTYKSVTTDSQGRITAGTNPTTLAGYGITDAAPLTHVGAGGVTQHPDATTSQSGFISVADLIAFRALQATTGLSSYSIPVGQVFPLWSRYSQEQDPVTGEMVFYEI